MASLDWELTPDGHESAGYRIRRIDGPLRWRLETPGRVTRNGGSAVSASIHPTLAEAKRRARHDENDRVRLARVRGHVWVGSAEMLVFAVLFGSMRTAGTFLVSMIFLYASLRSFVDAVAVGWGEAWTWTRQETGPERLSWSGRWVLAAMEHARRRQLAAMVDEKPPAIIMLPPEPSDAG